MRRKSFLATFLSVVVCLGLVVSTGCGGGAAPPPYYSGNSVVPISGPSVPGTEAFDQKIPVVLKKWDIPGATIAVTKNGKLVLARAYGYADLEAKQGMQPNAMMRIGSVSKMFGSVALLQLKEQGLVDLDAKFLDVLTEYSLPPNADQRLRNITIRMLLQHSGGWDRDVSGDPFNDQIKIAQALGVPSPAGCNEIIRYMLGKPLDFTPGTKTAYSNLGYCIIGRVIEKVSGEPYEIYIRDHVLAPIGIHAMYIGTARQGRQGPYEPKYYDYPGAPLYQSVFPGEGKVPAQYGVLELMDSPGGWVASAPDLLRFMTALEGSRSPSLLSEDLIDEFQENPGIPGKLSGPNIWYGLGVQVQQVGSEFIWEHGGSFPGDQTEFVRGLNGYGYTILTNSRGRDPSGLAVDISSAMATSVSTLDGRDLGGDLFADFPSPELPPKVRQ